MKLNSLIKESRFDKRIIEWSVRRKMITYAEYQTYLKSLSDLSNHCDNIISSNALKSNALKSNALKKEEKSNETVSD